MTLEQVFPYITALGGLILAYLGWRRTDKGDAAEQARWMGKIDAKLEGIEKKLDGMSGVPERVSELERRVTALERKGEESK